MLLTLLATAATDHPSWPCALRCWLCPQETSPGPTSRGILLEGVFQRGIRYEAMMIVGGELMSFGQYRTAFDAAHARDKAVRRLVSQVRRKAGCLVVYLGKLSAVADLQATCAAHGTTPCYVIDAPALLCLSLLSYAGSTNLALVRAA